MSPTPLKSRCSVRNLRCAGRRFDEMKIVCSKVGTLQRDEGMSWGSQKQDLNKFRV